MDKIIALTFDDGPNATTTMEVLDVLEKYNVVASFFLIGDCINEKSKVSVKRAVAMGCDIQNHSKTHSDMKEMSVEDIKAEIAYTTNQIEQITNKKVKFFRPPYIEVSQRMIDAIDLTFINGINGLDWEADVKAEKRAQLILDEVCDGNVILLHDMEGNEQTVKALDILIPKLLDQGYTFVTISELFEKKGINPQSHSGIVYSNALQTDVFLKN